MLYARVGTGHCPQCGRPITAQTREQILEQILALPTGTQVLVLAPLVRGQKGEYRDLFDDLLKQGFVRARVDGRVVRLSDDLRLDRQMRHDIEVVVDRLTVSPKVRGRLAEAVELALRLGEGNLIVASDEGRATRVDEEAGRCSDQSMLQIRSAKPQAAEIAIAAPLHLSAHYACTHCGLSFEPPSPQLFSFNSPQGMCPECSGLGEIYTFDPERLIPDPEPVVSAGLHRVGRARGARWAAGGGTSTAAWPRRLERNEDLPTGHGAGNRLGGARSRAASTPCSGAPATSTSPSPGGADRAGTSGAASSRAIIPKLLAQYRNTNSRLQRRQLEKYMRVLGCGHCRGAAAQPAGPRGHADQSASPQFADRPERIAARGLRAGRLRRRGVLQPSWNSTPPARAIAAEVLKEIRGRLGFLTNVGLDYLTLDRTAPTLSGGEMQRIRLAGQIGCGLVGVLYILDEPSIGLHPRDNDRLLDTLDQLRDQGNTVVVVEHDEDTMRAADHVVDFGPGPGVRGGRSRGRRPGRADRRRSRKSLTGPVPLRQAADRDPRRSGGPPATQRLVIRGAAHNNLKNIDVEIPLGAFVCVTGVSGSGKSSLVSDILVEALRRDLNGGLGNPGAHERIDGLEHLDKMIAIDQSPIGRTPRSNPATYIKVFDEIRNLYTQLPESKARGYKPGRFSFNVARRPLRGLRGQRLEQAGDGLPGRRLGHLPGLRRASLQPRDAAGPLQGQVDRRGAGDGRPGGAASTSRTCPRSATSCRRCTTWGSTT